jgi:hypothetical protein
MPYNPYLQFSIVAKIQTNKSQHTKSNGAINVIPPELLAIAKEGDIGIWDELLRELAQHAEVSPYVFFDSLAVLVAMDYSSETITFIEADAIMNVAFGGWCATEEFLAKNDTIPPLMFEVFLAFDAGEYYHPSDPPEVDPELKYTKPLIAKFLAEHM